VNAPAGYKKHSHVEDDIVPDDAKCDALSAPAGYKKPKRVYDETNPRPPRHMGRKLTCQLCYRGDPTFIDHVCRRCMKDWHDLELVEREMARQFPATAKMSRAQAFKKLLENYLTLRVKMKALRAAARGKQQAPHAAEGQATSGETP
jgi:hypothetical protein